MLQTAVQFKGLKDDFHLFINITTEAFLLNLSPMLDQMIKRKPLQHKIVPPLMYIMHSHYFKQLYITISISLMEHIILINIFLTLYLIQT